MEGDAAEGFGFGLVGVVLGLDGGEVVVLWFEMGVSGLFGCGLEGVWWWCECHCLCVLGWLLFSMRCWIWSRGEVEVK